MGTNAVGPAELKRLRERADLSVRRLAAALREGGSKFGKTPSSYAYYENDFKGAYLPMELVEALVPILVGRGTPPIEERQVFALAGRSSLWMIPVKFNEPPKVEIEMELFPYVIAAVRKQIAAHNLALTSEQEAQLIAEIYRRVMLPGSERSPSFVESEVTHACRLVTALLS